LADAVPLKSVGDASATIGAIHFGARIHNLLAISAFVLRGAEALRYKVVVLYHVSALAAVLAGVFGARADVVLAAISDEAHRTDA